MKVLKQSADGRVIPGDLGVVVGKSDDDLGEIEYGVFVGRLKRVYAFTGGDLLLVNLADSDEE